MSYLNQLAPKVANKGKKRLGRGMGSGLGKTSGRGHKGQRARSGGYHKVGFEGGQMPIQRRLPKFGFSSQKARCTEECRLSTLNALDLDIVSLETLQKAGVIKHTTMYVKIILSGTIEKAIKVQGLRATAGAKKAIEAAGGSVE